MKLHTFVTRTITIVNCTLIIICTFCIIRFDCGFYISFENVRGALIRMDTDLLTGFKSHSIPTYADLFKVKHSDNQALILLEDYLCYRALRESLSLRTSRWEYLVQSEWFCV